MLPSLTDLELDTEVSALTTEIDHLDEAIKLSERDREKAAARLVAAYLSELSKPALLKLQKDFPGFLTTARLAYYRQHLPRLGLFKPAGYALALTLLQAQFKAYLDESSHFAGEDGELRRLAVRKNEVSRRLIEFQRARELSRERAAEREREAQREEDRQASTLLLDPDDFGTTPRAVDDGITSAQFTMLQAVTTEVQQACTPEARETRECIATDDRLGYFS